MKISLEGDSWGAPPAGATRLIATAHELRTRPLSALSDEDLRLLIGQNIGLPHLLPLALERLRKDPLATGDLYEGALLKAVLSADPTFWKTHGELADQLRAVATSLQAPPSHLAAAIATLDERLSPTRQS